MFKEDYSKKHSRSENLRDRIKVILVKPRIPENVGFVARSMSIFGFRQLVLVEPAFTYDPLGTAAKTASGAHEVLNRVEVVPRLWDAIEDMHHVIGFSRREHHFKRPYLELKDWGYQITEAENSDRWALLFGSENVGLVNEDKVYCKSLVYIPQEHPTFSLNLSHAVTLVLYELYQNTPRQEAKPPVAPSLTFEQTQRIINDLVARLEDSHYFKAGRRERQIEFLRALVQRINLSQEEFHSVMGLFKSLNKKEQ